MTDKPGLFDDPYLLPYKDELRKRREHASHVESRLIGEGCDLLSFSAGHEFFGLHRRGGKWSFAEWAPNATGILMVGEFSQWQEHPDYRLQRANDEGHWLLDLPGEALSHGDMYRLKVYWDGGSGDRIPSFARRVVQDSETKIFNAQVWEPEHSYVWRNDQSITHPELFIYEAHIGMAQEREGVGSCKEFIDNTLPRIIGAGYNAIQLMAVMEHPYYGSFGYHVSSFFAASSRFGTPDDFKKLMDEIHGAGLLVIMDIVHSHAVKNEVEGLSRFDGTRYQYFHEGPRGEHEAWDSRCFDYGKPEVLHFLLSNCRFWLDEYRVDGFRFDGVTSMLYHHHGLKGGFSSYDDYFNDQVDKEAVAYLSLANKLIHQVKPTAITIAEDVSGMPGLAAPLEDGGCGFDYRLAMGVPDYWFKLSNDVSDEDWDIDYLSYELTNRRAEERTISYVESHDQALVGGKSMIFELIDVEMYNSMLVEDVSLEVDRGMALHKMMRLATIACSGGGYLNFMGNEFGHPEWIDFPREGNGWSYRHARRLWSLRNNPTLKYHFLADFDTAMLALCREQVAMANQPRSLISDNDEKVLVVARGAHLFYFNFHPSRSYADYAIDALPGEYSLALDTDEERFGGQQRVAAGQNYFTKPAKRDNTLHNDLLIYLPCRTALVLVRKS